MSAQVSAQKLCARIDEISSEIQKLEHNRSLLRRQLNETRDPMSRLPLELSSEIFLQYVRSLDQFEGRTLIMSICNTWSAIALSTPALWTTVHVDFPRGESMQELLPIWFQRAGNRPMFVSISLEGFENIWDHCVSDIIWRYGKQLKRLDIIDRSRISDYDARDIKDDIDIFGDENPADLELLLLETLNIRSFDAPRSFISEQILELLRVAPNLVECLIDSPSPLDEFQDHDEYNPELPNLRRLVLGEHEKADIELLRYLSLPALEALSVPINSRFLDTFYSLCEQSEPPLQHLSLNWESDDTEFPGLHDCLRLIPSVVQFTLWTPYPRLLADLFAALVDFPSLLPNLSSLRIISVDDSTKNRPYDIPDSTWRTLLRMVSTRRMQLHINCTDGPLIDVADGFRQLVTEGVDIQLAVAGVYIYAGTTEGNTAIVEARASRRYGGFSD